MFQATCWCTRQALQLVRATAAFVLLVSSVNSLVTGNAHVHGDASLLVFVLLVPALDAILECICGGGGGGTGGTWIATGYNLLYAANCALHDSALVLLVSVQYMRCALTAADYGLYAPTLLAATALVALLDTAQTLFGGQHTLSVRCYNCAALGDGMILCQIFVRLQILYAAQRYQARARDSCCALHAAYLPYLAYGSLACFLGTGLLACVRQQMPKARRTIAPLVARDDSDTDTTSDEGDGDDAYADWQPVALASNEK